MKLSEKVNLGINVIIIVGVGVFLFRPDGAGTAVVSSWLRARAIAERIEREWPSFSEQGGRLGNAEGEVVLVEFADYQCPVCQRAHNELTEVLRDYPEVALVFRHYPLRRIHPHAEAAARASICAEAQGEFEAMHEHLFSLTDWDDEPDWLKEAGTVGVRDLTEFAACLDSPSTSERLTLDHTLGTRLGVRATPTFISRQGPHVGLLLREELDSLLARP